MTDSTLHYTPVGEIRPMFESLRDAFLAGRAQDVEFRKTQLRGVAFLFQEHEKEVVEAMKADSGRPAGETVLYEIGYILQEVKMMLEKLDSWVKPQKVKTDLLWSFSSPKVHAEPKGVCLIIGAWNYPVSLLVGPLLGAIAAGCTVMLKPSENSPHVAALLTELLPNYIDPSVYRFVNGAVEETTEALRMEWDHICYTGSTKVGKIVASAAAKNLTTTTLELGGKNPVVIMPDADLAQAARRIMQNRMLNSGQTCISSDYVLAPARLHSKLAEEFKKAVLQFYPDGFLSEAGRDKSSRIVNRAQWERIKGLMERSKGEVVTGGKWDEQGLKIEPTVSKVSPDDSLMEDEIFGPVLSLVEMETIEEAAKYINSRPSPLGIYIYTNNSKNIEYLRKHTRSGALVANAGAVQWAVPGLPFGGVGHSGQGHWHGHYSFMAFSYERSLLTVPTGGWFEKLVFGNMYPPMKEATLKQMRMLMLPKITKRTGRKGFGFWWISVVLALAAAAAGYRRRIASA